MILGSPSALPAIRCAANFPPAEETSFSIETDLVLFGWSTGATVMAVGMKPRLNLRGRLCFAFKMHKARRKASISAICCSNSANSE